MSEFGRERGMPPQEAASRVERPSSEEVDAFIEARLHGAEPLDTQRESDEDGLKRLVVEAMGESEGEKLEYIYDRDTGAVTLFTYDGDEEPQSERLAMWRDGHWETES